MILDSQLCLFGATIILVLKEPLLEPLDPTALIHSFLKLKDALLKALARTLSNHTLHFILIPQLKNNAVGAVGHQKGPTSQAVAYLSKQFDGLLAFVH